VSVAGNWNLAVDSPMGRQQVRLALQDEGDQLAGTVTNNASGITAEIFDAQVNGDQLSWKFKMSQFKLTLSFTTTVNGETMAGRVKAGLFGSFNVTGERADRDQLPVRAVDDESQQNTA
jgi:hypothetical protein